MEEETKELIFKSEEERGAAFAKISDEPPLGENIDEWQQKHDTEVERVAGAKIDPEAKPEDIPPETPPEDKLPDPPPENKPPSTEEQLQRDLAAAQRRNDELAGQMRQLTGITEKQSSLEKTIEELKKQNEELQKNPPQPPQPSKVDVEIGSVQSQIQKIEDELNGIDPEETEKRQKKSEELIKENLRYTRLLEKKSNDAFEETRQMQKKIQEEREKEIEAGKREQAERTRKNKEEEKQSIIVKGLESFRNSKDRPELQSEQSYLEMEKEVGDWAFQIAALDTGKPANKVLRSEAELSIKRYMNKTPTLLDRVKENAIKEPTNLNKWAILSELELARRGEMIDPSTGKVIKRVDELGNQVILPDFDSAYTDVKRRSGSIIQELADRDRNTAKGVVDAMNQRQDPKELNEPHISEEVGKMSVKDATEVINSMDEKELVEAARLATQSGEPLPKKVEAFNRAMEVIGALPITGNE